MPLPPENEAESATSSSFITSAALSSTPLTASRAANALNVPPTASSAIALLRTVQHPETTSLALTLLSSLPHPTNPSLAIRLARSAQCAHPHSPLVSLSSTITARNLAIAAIAIPPAPASEAVLGPALQTALAALTATLPPSQNAFLVRFAAAEALIDLLPLAAESTLVTLDLSATPGALLDLISEATRGVAGDPDAGTKQLHLRALVAGVGTCDILFDTDVLGAEAASSLQASLTVLPAAAAEAFGAGVDDVALKAVRALRKLCERLREGATAGEVARMGKMVAKALTAFLLLRLVADARAKDGDRRGVGKEALTCIASLPVVGRVAGQGDCTCGDVERCGYSFEYKAAVAEGSGGAKALGEKRNRASVDCASIVAEVLEDQADEEMVEILLEAIVVLGGRDEVMQRALGEVVSKLLWYVVLGEYNEARDSSAVGEKAVKALQVLVVGHRANCLRAIESGAWSVLGIVLGNAKRSSFILAIAGCLTALAEHARPCNLPTGTADVLLRHLNAAEDEEDGTALKVAAACASALGALCCVSKKWPSHLVKKRTDMALAHALPICEDESLLRGLLALTRGMSSKKSAALELATSGVPMALSQVLRRDMEQLDYYCISETLKTVHKSVAQSSLAARGKYEETGMMDTLIGILAWLLPLSVFGSKGPAGDGNVYLSREAAVHTFLLLDLLMMKCSETQDSFRLLGGVKIIVDFIRQYTGCSNSLDIEMLSHACRVARSASERKSTCLAFCRTPGFCSMLLSALQLCDSEVSDKVRELASEVLRAASLLMASDADCRLEGSSEIERVVKVMKQYPADASLQSRACVFLRTVCGDDDVAMKKCVVVAGGRTAIVKAMEETCSSDVELNVAGAKALICLEEIFPAPAQPKDEKKNSPALRLAFLKRSSPAALKY